MKDEGFQLDCGSLFDTPDCAKFSRSSVAPPTEIPILRCDPPATKASVLILQNCEPQMR